MGLRVEQGIRRSSKRILRLVPYESPAFKAWGECQEAPVRSLSLGKTKPLTAIAGYKSHRVGRSGKTRDQVVDPAAHGERGNWAHQDL